MFHVVVGEMTWNDIYKGLMNYRRESTVAATAMIIIYYNYYSH